jgi:hypothetical protein
MTHHTAEHRSPETNECIDNCMRCHAVCLETIDYCLDMGGAHAAPDHISLMAACADICATSADTMLRGSNVHGVICGACAEVCRRCADDCERMGGEDESMKRCAEFCRRCAESCARMTA